MDSSWLGRLLLSGAALAAPFPLDHDGALGTWALHAGNARRTLVVVRQADGKLSATLADDAGAAHKVEELRWNPASRELTFREPGKGQVRWYRGRVVEDILVGRFADHAGAGAPRAEEYKGHVTGYNSTRLDQDIVPRVWEVLAHNNYPARLRIDRAPGRKGFVGTFKVYANTWARARGEEFEQDIEVKRWDGKTLEFVRPLGGGTVQEYRGRVQGRHIRGTFQHTGVPAALPWHGSRAEVLSHGLAEKSLAGRTAWQERTRRQLEHLMMAGNPRPLSTRVTVLRANLPPFPSRKYHPSRDDNPERWPQNYRLSELHIDCTLPNPHGGAALSRRLHAYLAVPTGKAPAAGWPAVLAVNGHGGSARQMVDPDSGYFWYGDSFARRGYIVLALDISHRPVADRRGLYGGGGDDPAGGNDTHPAIKAPGFDSDWEEDGERAWDSMRGIDVLLSRRDVDPRRLVVTGLSMGGEVTIMVSALDPRVCISIPAGYSPDMGVMLHHGNHACWRWLNADIREYVDVSDFLALIAPRPLLVQTGKRDFTFSALKTPFAADKQVLRRARSAYGSGALVHYLHHDEHRYHVGDINPTGGGERGVRIPVVAAPAEPGDVAWQSDARTRSIAPTLFDWITAQGRQGRPRR